MPPLRWNLTLIACTVALTGCTVVSAGAPRPVNDHPVTPAPHVVPQYFTGEVVLGGQRLEVSLELRGTDPPRYDAVLLIPEISLEARGEGRVTDESLSLDLVYGDDACPGQMHVEARVDPEGRGAAGALAAMDCTGGESGTIRVARLAAGPNERGRLPR